MKIRRLFIRWRKSSATWVVYEGRNTILESGFNTPQDARNWIEECITGDVEIIDEIWRGKNNSK
jgi:hypothetical protein